MNPRCNNQLRLSLLHPLFGFCLDYRSAHDVHQPFLASALAVVVLRVRFIRLT